MWIRNEIHRRKGGGVTIKPRFVGWKRKPRRKRRDQLATAIQVTVLNTFFAGRANFYPAETGRK